MANILITGGYGYIGSRLAIYLSKYFKVTISFNNRNFALNKIFYKYKINQINLNITNKIECLKKINKFDYVIHLAALDELKSVKNYKKTLYVNTLGTRNILEACKKNNIQNFIYFSTIHIYGNINELKYVDENSIPMPLNDYSLTHYFSEKYIISETKNKNINGLILRLSNGFGYPIHKSINRWSLIFNDACRQIFLDKSMIFKTNGKVFRNFISISEICLFIKKIIVNPYYLNKFYKSNSIDYNLASSKNITIYDLCLTIKKIFEKKYKKKVELKINEKDKSSYNKCIISNKKVKKIGYKDKNFIKEEAINSFKILSS